MTFAGELRFRRSMDSAAIAVALIATAALAVSHVVDVWLLDRDALIVAGSEPSIFE
jgi:hypothetical protein